MASRNAKIAESPTTLAKALGVGRATAHRWVRDGCPRRDDGSFDVDEVAMWVRQMRADGRRRAAEARATRRNSPGLDIVEDLGTGYEGRERAEVELTTRKVKLGLLALDLKIQQGAYVPRTELQTELDKRMLMFKRRLSALGRRLSQKLVNIPDAREIQLLIGQETDQLLWECYGKPPSDGDDDDQRDPVAE